MRALWATSAEQRFPGESIGQISISPTTVWRQANTWGEKLKQQAEVQRAIANALPSREQGVPGEVKTQPRLEASLDGAMVPVRYEPTL